MPDRMKPTVSVVIPTFNRSNFVSNAIDSVLKQTYKDYEIIVVDDGSTDDTAEKLSAYVNQIRYVYQKNQGVSAARNKGIELARGEWIALLDSDDLWLPIKLECQLRAIKRLGKEFGACFTDCTFCGNPNADLSAFEQAGLQTDSEFAPLSDPFKYILARYPSIYVQSLIVLHSLCKELNGFDEHMIVAEDTDLLFRLAFKTQFCFVSVPMVYVDRPSSREVGLVELFKVRDDLVFCSLEHMYNKWLSLPEEVDPTVRSNVWENLRLLYYHWIVAGLYKFRLPHSLKTARKINKMGDSYMVILNTLLFRMIRKILSILRG